ncbi:VENN motif pre-toxin domain-containing protein [Pseudomonas graminis]
MQRAIQAAVQGLAGGDIAKAIAGGSAPYIANIIGNSGLDDAGKELAHAAVNAALATAQGNSALAGATGAATAELAGIVAVNAYGKPVSELSETEKQTVSALAGGLIGDSGSTTIAAAQAGKTTVENNLLGCSGSSDPLCVGKKDLLTTGGGGLGPVAGGIGAAGVLTTGGDKEGEDQPNVGKDLTDAEKAELGGAG